MAKPAKKAKIATQIAAPQPEMPRLIPRPDGRGALLSGGVPGHVGGPGRPPDWLRAWCDDLLADPESQQQVAEVVKDKKHAAFATMWKAIADRAHGRPAETVKGDLTVTLKIVHVDDDGPTA